MSTPQRETLTDEVTAEFVAAEQSMALIDWASCTERLQPFRLKYKPIVDVGRDTEQPVKNVRSPSEVSILLSVPYSFLKNKPAAKPGSSR